MLKRFCAAMLVLVAAIAVASCTGEPAPSPSVEPTAVMSPSVAPTAVISPNESPSPTPEPMSYEEYFGTVRAVTTDSESSGIYDFDEDGMPKDPFGDCIRR